jgi:hypothetical protein
MPLFSVVRSLHLQSSYLSDHFVCTGDLAYADGFLANWEFFMDMISPVAGTTMLYVATSWFIPVNIRKRVALL